MLSVDGREYPVDVGYAAPFLEPILLDLPVNYSVNLGAHTYVLRSKDQAGRTRVELHRNGALRHGYLINPSPREIQEFSHVITESFAPQATFMNAIFLVRFEADRPYIIHNRELSEVRGTNVKRQLLSTADELVDAIHTYFEMPDKMVRALDGISLEGNAWN